MNSTATNSLELIPTTAPSRERDIAGLAQAQDWTRDTGKVDLVKRTICVGATDDELELFLTQCRRTELDPFSRQIYAIKRSAGNGKSTMTIQVSIDGFRLIADRSGAYQGQTSPQWCGPDGEWRDVWLSDATPAAARVGVWRSGFREPVYGVARFSSYAQMTSQGAPSHMWAKMPDVMLAKCAEALALRKAFPHELSGLYSTEEMEQADNPAPMRPASGPAQNRMIPPSRPAPPMRNVTQPAEPSDAQRRLVSARAFRAEAGRLGLDREIVDDAGKPVQAKMEALLEKVLGGPQKPNADDNDWAADWAEGTQKLAAYAATMKQADVAAVAKPVAAAAAPSQGTLLGGQTNDDEDLSDPFAE